MSWDEISPPSAATWGDDTRSDTTLDNYSRFILLNFRSTSTDVVRLTPQIRSVDAKRGPSFCVTQYAPVELRNG